MHADNLESFHPTNGRVFGVLAVLIGLGIAVLALSALDGAAWWLVAAGVLFAALAWCAMLRPQVAVSNETLVLRNMVDTIHIPLAAVEEVVVRQVLAVRVGDKRYTSPAVGRTRRQIQKHDRGGASPSADPIRLIEDSYGVYVESRIRELAKDARERRGLRSFSAEQSSLAGEVERDLALPEIVVLAVSAVALLVFVIL